MESGLTKAVAAGLNRQGIRCNGPSAPARSKAPSLQSGMREMALWTRPAAPHRAPADGRIGLP